MSTSTTLPRRRLLLGLLLLLLLLLIAGVFLAIRLTQRGVDYLTRPLVLLHDPRNGQRIALGDGLSVYANARSDAGLTRIELWAEGRLVARHDVTDAVAPTQLPLATFWEPDALGRHVLTVQAVAANGLTGHAAVTVEVIDAIPTTGAHTVREGETLESIAADYNARPEDLAFLNPSLPSGGPLSGDELRVPLDLMPSDEADSPAPAEGDSSPPGVPDSIADEVVPSAPVPLRIEALALETDAVYESVHCYASVAGQTPRWYPDSDDDPATDESFTALSGLAWDVAAHMSGDQAPTLVWPSDQALPFEITCVGILGGGTDAVELGTLSLAIPLERWDGERRRASSAGGEGAFDLEYRVGLGDTHPLDLDLSMAPPVNLRYDDSLQSLLWEYAPLPGHESDPPIDGFLIFLNETQVWEVSRESRVSRLPIEWLNPPCGVSYVFTARSFRSPYPTGPYSVPSNAATLSGGEPGTEACNRQYVVTFEQLRTEDLGGDGDRDPGDMGPIFGMISANDERSSFDGRCPDIGPGEGRVCTEIGIDSQSTYDLTDFHWTDAWPRNQLFVNLTEGDDLNLSFYLADADTGWNARDDEVCSGYRTYTFDDLTSGWVEDTMQAGPLGSDDLRCHVDYRIDSAPGSPVGAGSGDPPLPWLDVVDRTIDPATGQLQIHIRNTGTAAWAHQDLEIEATRHDGTSLGTFRWPHFYLAAGAPEVVLQDPGLVPDPPRDVCVQIDPQDRVLERLEYFGILYHGRVCFQLPDLVIEGVEYQANTADLAVTVANQGEGAVENEALSLAIIGPDGSEILPRYFTTALDLDAHQTTVIFRPDIEETQRRRMMGGYTVRINPDEAILETDPGNNDFAVPPGHSVWVDLRGTDVTGFFENYWFDPYWPTHHFYVSFNVEIVGGASTQPIDSWSFDFDFKPEYRTNGHSVACTDCETSTLDIGGDERLVVSAAASVRESAHTSRDSLGSMAATFDLQSPSQARLLTGRQDCNWSSGDGYYHMTATAYDVGESTMPRTWAVGYCLLRVED